MGGGMVPRTLELHPSTLRRLVRLAKEAERDGSYRVSKRLQAIVMNAEGYSSGEIARILKAPRSKTSEWLRLYEEHAVHSAAGSVAFQQPIGYAKAAPSETMIARLVAVDESSGERLLGEYTFNHTRTIPGFAITFRLWRGSRGPHRSVA